ncbi:hypothetical protein QUB43_19580 [Microcoleus sp. A6-D4]
MKPYLICPTCGSDDVMKNGMTRRGKLSPQMSRLWSAVCRKSELGHPKTPTLWQKLSCFSRERISLAGIALLHGRF